MINIFEQYYIIDPYPERLNPLSKKELLSGMPLEAVEEYLSLVEKLYYLSVFDTDKELSAILDGNNIKKEENKWQIYTSILELLFRCDLISESAQFELSNTNYANFDFLRDPCNPAKFIVDSVDDFRLSFERNMAEIFSNDSVIDNYLKSRYGYIFVYNKRQHNSNNYSEREIVRYDRHLSEQDYPVASYWEVRNLLLRIESDIKNVIEEQDRLDSVFCIEKRKEHYGWIFEKWAYGKPKNIAEWYTMKRALKVTEENLRFLEIDIRLVFNKMTAPEKVAGVGETLYVYKGNIYCRQNKHQIVPATATLYDNCGREILLNVEFCPQCQKYLLGHSSFLQYREKHDILVGKLKMISLTGDYGDFELAAESPLKLCGYTVSQSLGLSSASRQYILAKIIHDGIMTKLEVVHYLEHFINMNGAKSENKIALEKWYDDLDFVHRYNQEIQPQVYISQIENY